MRNRERFNSCVDEEREKLISARITVIKRIFKKLETDLHCTAAQLEPCEYQLVWGSLWRCLTCLESCIALISQGYTGSANALLRQIMEFLLWAKLGLEADDAAILKLNQYFYDDSLEKNHPVTRILKHVVVKDFEEYTGAELKNEGKEAYHKYSYFTHACSAAQQNPYKQDYFYEMLEGCLGETCMMLDIFILVFAQYCRKVMAAFGKITSQDSYDFCNMILQKTPEDRHNGHMMVAAMQAGSMFSRLESYREKLLENDLFFPSNLHYAFIADWVVDGERI